MTKPFKNNLILLVLVVIIGAHDTVRPHPQPDSTLTSIIKELLVL